MIDTHEHAGEVKEAVTDIRKTKSHHANEAVPADRNVLAVFLAVIACLEWPRCQASASGWLDGEVLRPAIFFRNANLSGKDSRSTVACKS